MKNKFVGTSTGMCSAGQEISADVPVIDLHIPVEVPDTPYTDNEIGLTSAQIPHDRYRFETFSVWDNQTEFRRKLWLHESMWENWRLKLFDELMKGYINAHNR